ncbi:MAG: hypothetical protein ACOYOQ_09515, partial [Microthrixaceae bacterium]
MPRPTTSRPSGRRHPARRSRRVVAATSGASCAGLVAVLAGGAGAQGVTANSPPDLGLPTAAVRPLSVGAPGAPMVGVDASAPSPDLTSPTALPPVPTVPGAAVLPTVPTVPVTVPAAVDPVTRLPAPPGPLAPADSVRAADAPARVQPPPPPQPVAPPPV